MELITVTYRGDVPIIVQEKFVYPGETHAIPAGVLDNLQAQYGDVFAKTAQPFAVGEVMPVVVAKAGKRK